jgi:hypothetical protein
MHNLLSVVLHPSAHPLFDVDSSLAFDNRNRIEFKALEDDDADNKSMLTMRLLVTLELIE